MTITFLQYELLKRIPGGIFGDVTLGRVRQGPETGKQYVIKTLNPYLFDGAEVQPEWVTGVLDINAVLQHPGIIPITDGGEADGEYYLAMPFVHGDTLQGISIRLQRAEKRITVPIALRIIADASETLAWAHSRRHRLCPQGVVHGNLTPRNVFVRFDDGRVVLTDFAIDRIKALTGRASSGTIAGKYAHLSPEQLRGAPAAPPSDVFSLGVNLYQLLAQNKLFQRKSEFDTIKAILDCDIAPLRQFAPDVSPEVEDLVSRALQRDPHDRFPSAQAFGDAIRSVLATFGNEGSQAATRDFVRSLYAEYLRTHTNESLPSVTRKYAL